MNIQTVQIAQILLGILFGMILGVAGTFGYVVLRGFRDAQNATRANEDLSQLLREVTEGKGEVTIKRIKKKPRSEAIRPAKGD